MTAEVLHLPIGRRHPGAPRGLCHRVVRPPELDRWPAAYAAVLARHSGQREFALATPRGSVAVDCRASISLAELAAQWSTAPAVDLPAVAGVAVREAYPRDAAALWLVVDDESVALDYDTSVWSAESASALLDCCHTLVTADPARPQRDIPIGDVALIDTSGAQLTGPGLDELVRDWASRTPDAVAVVCQGREVSYAELDRLVDHQVARLRGCGARRGDRVCVLLDRDLDWVAVELALLRIGAACVPLDREYPRARHELVLDDTAPVLLVTGRRHGLHDGPVRTLLMDDVPAPDSAETAPGPRGGESVERVSEVAAADTAYVFYTSGSTGRPKGVLVPHGSLRNLLAAQRDLLKLGP
ncbi:MAG: AMP-binding protein, partial [Micromonosporaceae bacterium]